MKKEPFVEFTLEYGTEKITSTKLTYLLRLVRNNKIKKYVISGLRGGIWEVIIKH